MSDAGLLREFLLRRDGTDFDLADDALTAYAAQAKAYVERTGYRWSWKALAAQSIHEAQRPETFGSGLGHGR